MNMTKKIYLTTQMDVIEFTQSASKSKGRVDCIESYRNINGKSILGVLSMDLSYPITVVFYNVTGGEAFLKDMEKWEVKENNVSNCNQPDS